MRRTSGFRVPAAASVAAATALSLAASGAAQAAAPQYLTEARCLGVYEAGFHIFSRINEIGAAAGAGALIAGAVHGAAKMSYEQTIEAVIARNDMNDDELDNFRHVHQASSDVVMSGYEKGDLDFYDTGQLIYACDVELGYTEEELG